MPTMRSQRREVAESTSHLPGTSLRDRKISSGLFGRRVPGETCRLVFPVTSQPL